MKRDDKSNYFLFLDPRPEDKSTEPVNDKLTALVQMAFDNSTEGTSRYSDPEDINTFRGGSGYKGIHLTRCGERSSNKDYLLENGLITNSLCVYYVRWYRNSISENDMIKLNQLKQFYSK